MALQMNSRFLSVVVHDLRTPLNAITLTMRLVEQSVAVGNSAELQDDLRVLNENVRQIERMLAQLSEHCRLSDDAIVLRKVAFDPRRMMRDIVEDDALEAAHGSAPELVVRSGCPEMVELDPAWALAAARHAVENALAAAEGGPVKVTLGGQADRLVIEVTVGHAPPPSVHSTRLRSDQSERLMGGPHERRGLELALAARVSELFGGTARLEVAPSRSSTIVLDWPTSLESPAHSSVGGARHGTGVV
ncbi:MAG TPA: HAMP domain-containing sensor histidine kinase [Isosphaeraceae bacterium]|nr:HAMP domain-containing sensor histidine kinase [Isosphaeraceae bacterium]